MTKHSTLFPSILLSSLATVGWLGGPVVRAQAPAIVPPEAAHAGEVETDPIQCWWKTDTPTVVAGEQFGLTLTCAVIETSRIRVVPHRTELEPGTLQLSPFELVDGRSFEDVVTPPWRYFQYEYTLRLLNEGFFGKDVEIPQLRVVYNIESVENEGTQGRDQGYLLPAMSMRVVSLVPQQVSDIRDAHEGTFGEIESRLFRSTQEFVAAMILFGFAAVLAAVAAARLFGVYRARVPVARTLPMRSVLGGCVNELARLKTDVARQGWTPELAGRALAAFRLAGSVALGRDIAQTIVARGDRVREGQIRVKTGLLGRRHVLVSAAATATAIDRRLAAGDGLEFDARTKAALGEIRDSLATFNAIRYGRNGQLEPTALDRALDNGTVVVRQLRVAALWPKGLTRGARKAAPPVGGMEWSR